MRIPTRGRHPYVRCHAWRLARIACASHDDTPGCGFTAGAAVSGFVVRRSVESPELHVSRLHIATAPRGRRYLGSGAGVGIRWWHPARRRRQGCEGAGCRGPWAVTGRCSTDSTPRITRRRPPAETATSLRTRRVSRSGRGQVADTRCTWSGRRWPRPPAPRRCP